MGKSYSIGMVPTMGALHDGHLSLIEKALIENDKVLVTIFVNPTQFEDNSDLKNYPNELKKDLEKISQFGKNVSVFSPEKSAIYGDEVHAKKYDLNNLPKEVQELIKGMQVADAQLRMHEDTLKVLAVGRQHLAMELKSKLESIESIT